MELDISTIMLVIFVILFVVSMWKVYAFLPNKTLEDDDTTKESQEELMNLVKKYRTPDIHTKKLLTLIQNDDAFDKKHFWRFNENKLNQLLIKMEY